MKSNIAALVTVLVLLFIEQIVYGMFYSDLSFITQSFFPSVKNGNLCVTVDGQEETGLLCRLPH